MKTDSRNLFIDCIQLKFIKDRDTSDIFERITKDPVIAKTIEGLARKFSQMNPSLSYKELIVDIKSTLYLCIIEEFNIDSNRDKVRSWLYSVLKWRTLDKIKKDCELNYDIETKKYSNTNKVSIDSHLNEVDSVLIEETSNLMPRVRGDKADRQTGEYINLEYVIRKSRVSSLDKAILLFTFVYGNSLKEVGEIVGKSDNVLRERLLPNAIANFMKSFEETGLFDKETLYEILNKHVNS